MSLLGATQERSGARAIVSRTYLESNCPTRLLAGVEQYHAVALGKVGGRKSAKARMEKLTRERRREIARNAVLVRWAMARKQKSGRERKPAS